MDTKNGKRRINILVAVLLVLNAVTLGALWYLYIDDDDQANTQDKRRRHIEDFMKKRMDFNEEQSKKLLALREEHFREKKIIMDSVRLLKRELVEEIMKNRTDSVAIQRITSTIAALLADNEENFTMHFIKVKEICTPEQRTKLRSFLDRKSVV